MFDLFKKDKGGLPKDVKTIRDRLVHFIRKQWQKAEGGEGKNIKGLQLYISCSSAEKHVYESAVYFEEPDRFKNEEIQKSADDFAIALPANWTMEIIFIEKLPPEAIKVPYLDAALFIVTRKRSLQKVATAYLRVLNGEAEKEEYTLTPDSGKTTIGREKKVQTKDGFYRVNDIAFPANSNHESNKFISRQHAHIEYNSDTGFFMLFADEGGIPPHNKIKVLSTHEVNPVKLHTTLIGHTLKEGDQIVLGQSAVLQFSYSKVES